MAGFALTINPVFDPQRLHGKKPGALRVFFGSRRLQHRCRKSWKEAFIQSIFLSKIGSRVSRGRVEEESRNGRGIARDNRGNIED